MHLGKFGNMKEQLENTYSGKKIFITGHTGFKGAWLLKLLSILGADIKGYALETKLENDLYNLINGDTLCNSVLADLRDKERLTKEILDFQPDYIFHLAAQPLVRLSYEIPVETFVVNAIGTANLLDAIRLLKTPASIVLITTDKVYHNNEWVFPYRENDRLGGHDPYSTSKACAELIIDSYRNSFFSIKDYDIHKKGIAVARAGNVIGGGDWSRDRLIPDIAKAISNDVPALIRNPNAVRPWQHVLEPLVGYLRLGEKLGKQPQEYSGAFNFGPYISDTLSVREMAELVIKTWGKGTYELINPIDLPHEAGLLKLDISKSLEFLNWKPTFTANNAVQFTIDWYKSYYESPSLINTFTSQQIFDFLNND